MKVTDEERLQAVRDLETAHLEFLAIFHKVGFACNQVSGRIDFRVPQDQRQAKAYIEAGCKLADYFSEAANRLRNQLQVFSSTAPLLPEGNILAPGPDDLAVLKS